MKLPAAIRRKSTAELRKKLEKASSNDRFEVIVRVKDPGALDKPQTNLASGQERMIASEQQRAQQLLENLTQYVQQLIAGGEPVGLVDTSWLAQALLISAVPATIAKLADREDVDMLDINAEFNLPSSKNVSSDRLQRV